MPTHPLPKLDLERVPLLITAEVMNTSYQETIKTEMKACHNFGSNVYSHAFCVYGSHVNASSVCLLSTWIL